MRATKVRDYRRGKSVVVEDDLEEELDGTGGVHVYTHGRDVNHLAEAIEEHHNLGVAGTIGGQADDEVETH